MERRLLAHLCSLGLGKGLVSHLGIETEDGPERTPLLVASPVILGTFTVNDPRGWHDPSRSMYAHSSVHTHLDTVNRKREEETTQMLSYKKVIIK